MLHDDKKTLTLENKKIINFTTIKTRKVLLKQFQDEADIDFEAPKLPGTTTADVDDDIVDSDFSIDENDEPRSDVENEDDPDKPKKMKRGQGVQTKAYKEPKREQVS
jgi:hypothetical protein